MVGLPDYQIGFEMLGMGTVLKRHRLVVPLNQREYSWEERHVRELFQDLAEAISSGKQTYFLGVIVLTNGSEGSLEIADGQQRLATTTILLAAIRDYFYNRKDNDMVSDLGYFLDTFVRETREHNPRLRLNVADHEFFKNRVLELPDSTLREQARPMRPSHERLNEAAELAEEHVQSILSPLGDAAKNDYLNTWISFIENSAQVIVLKVSDDLNAYVMFETLNDRGLRVSQSDLVKNYLFSQATGRIPEAQERWASMNGALETLEDDEATINFLRHLLISLYGHVRERDVLERVRRNVVGRAPTIQFLDNLNSAAGDYVALQMPENKKWSNSSKRFRQNLEDLLLLRVTPLRPLMLSIVRNFTPEETELVFSRFVSWSVRWLTAGGARSGRLEAAIGITAKKVTDREINTLSGLAESLGSVLPNDSRFALAFRNLTIANHRLARYYLRTLEIAHNNQAEPEWVPNEDTVITLEHVLPEHPSNNWPNIEAAIHSTYYKRLGNMALLAATLNRDIGNDSFDEKKPVLESSDYQLTKEISTEKVWSPAEIEKRQDRLSQLAVKAWPLL